MGDMLAPSKGVRFFPKIRKHQPKVSNPTDSQVSVVDLVGFIENWFR